MKPIVQKVGIFTSAQLGKFTSALTLGYETIFSALARNSLRASFLGWASGV
jgi:hypothetical protein